MRSIKFVQHNDEYDSYYSFVENDEGLKQHGVMGMHWGERKYQNKDGSLTPAGRIHYGVGLAKKKAASVMEKTKHTAKTIDDSINSANNKIAKKLKPIDDKISEKTKPINDLYNNTNDKITEKMKPVDDFVNKVSDKMANIFSENRRAENKAKKEAEKVKTQSDRDKAYDVINQGAKPISSKKENLNKEESIDVSDKELPNNFYISQLKWSLERAEKELKNMERSNKRAEEMKKLGAEYVTPYSKSAMKLEKQRVNSLKELLQEEKYTTRRIVSLKKQDYTIEEIAKKLGISESTVSSYLYNYD